MIGLQQAALGYNEMGWPIFRLQPKGKTPIGGTRGRDDASTDTILVNRWWTELPTLNVGLATGDESGFFVLDADPDKGGDESLQRLQQEHGALPQTRVAISGSGGTHHYFLMHGGCIRWQRDKLSPPEVVSEATAAYLAAEDSSHGRYGRKRLAKKSATRKSLSRRLRRAALPISENTAEDGADLRASSCCRRIISTDNHC